MSDLLNELSFYTLTHPDAERFIHQHAVDTHTAQMADGNTKPIAVVYSLVGLYLATERKFTGKQVQKAHMILSKDKRNMPAIQIPANKGTLTIQHVLDTQPGAARDQMLMQWCADVWHAYAPMNAKAIGLYCHQHLAAWLSNPMS